MLVPFFISLPLAIFNLVYDTPYLKTIPLCFHFSNKPPVAKMYLNQIIPV